MYIYYNMYTTWLPIVRVFSCPLHVTTCVWLYPSTCLYTLVALLRVPPTPAHACQAFETDGLLHSTWQPSPSYADPAPKSPGTWRETRKRRANKALWRVGVLRAWQIHNNLGHVHTSLCICIPVSPLLTRSYCIHSLYSSMIALCVCHQMLFLYITYMSADWQLIRGSMQSRRLGMLDNTRGPWLSRWQSVLKHLVFIPRCQLSY